MFFLLAQLHLLHFLHALLALADEVDVVAAHFEHAGQLDLFDGREVEWVDLFDANATGDFADGHAAGLFRTTDIRHQAFVDLDTFFFFAIGTSFLDLLVDTNGHPGFNLGGFDRGWEGKSFGHMNGLNCTKKLIFRQEEGLFGLEHLFEVFPGPAIFQLNNLFWDAFPHHLTPSNPPFRANIDDVVGAFNDVQVVLDD